jgi:hypothetical protein
MAHNTAVPLVSRSALKSAFILISLAILLAGCFDGHGDELEKTSRLEWVSMDTLSVCIGDTVKCDFIKSLADPKTNTWKSVRYGYTGISLAYMDSSLLWTAAPNGLIGSAPGKTRASARDTIDGLLAPWRSIKVVSCADPAP